MPDSPPTRPTFDVIGVPVHATTLDECTSDLVQAAEEKTKGWVIFRDVHGLVRCQDDPDLRTAHLHALRVCPDGMPLVWIGRFRGFRSIRRVYGPDLMRSVMEATQHRPLTHFLYGGAPGVAEVLKKSLESTYPSVKIVGTACPPYKPLSEDEVQHLKQTVQEVRPDFFWVGLGTPKQELFMARYSQLLDTSVLLGVGAAFDYLSDNVHEPPPWIRKSGFQWLIRIFQEPRRLLGRYLHTLPRFVLLLFLNKKGCVKPPSN